MSPPLTMNSASVPTSMEGIGSSTASRGKRGEWLSRSKSNIIIKIVLGCAIAGIICAAVVVIVPFAKKTFSKKTSASYPSSHHNMIKNSTYDGDEMLKSYGFRTGLEKDALQLCDLSPESRNELGKSTWALLHIMAATYPVDPTPDIIQDHRIFFQLLPRIYPCPDCRVHMRKMFNELPPQLDNRTAFMNWMCEAHNRVNLRLNKPIFDCTKLDERWDCGCNIIPGQGLTPKDEALGLRTTNGSKAEKEDKKDRKSRASKVVQKVDKKEKDHRKSRTSKVRNADYKSLFDANVKHVKTSKSNGHAPLLKLETSNSSEN